MVPRVIFETSHYLVLEKPYGWVVNAAVTAAGKQVVQQYLDEHYTYPLAHDELRRSGLVHRLDKDTSGLLLVAKSPETYETLQGLFKHRKIHKIYQVLVHGWVKDSEGLIEGEIGRLPINRQRFGIVAGGKPALSRYRLINLFYDPTGGKVSYLEVFPETGRTHQIRVHLKFIGHSVVGDPWYNGRKTYRQDQSWCPRLFLHASGMSFDDPWQQVKVKYFSPLPTELHKVLTSLLKDK